jgi:hypothetical protein
VSGIVRPKADKDFVEIMNIVKSILPSPFSKVGHSPNIQIKTINIKLPY